MVFGILGRKKKKGSDGGSGDGDMDSSYTKLGRGKRNGGSSDGSLPSPKRRSTVIRTPPLDPASAVGGNERSTSFSGKYAPNHSNKGRFFHCVPEDLRRDMDNFETFTGWTVQVKRLPIAALESMIDKHQTLVWDKRYWRGLGRKARVIDDDESDLTLQLHFENPHATAWFPIAAVDILSPPSKGLNGNSRGSSSSGGTKATPPTAGVAPTLPESKHRGDPAPKQTFDLNAKLAVKGVRPGDYVVRKSDLEGSFGVVIGYDETEEDPVLVEWRDRKTEKRLKITEHKEEELRKFDRDADRRANMVRGGADSDSSTTDFAGTTAAKTWADKTEMIFKFFDTNDDGYWSVEELNAYLQASEGIPLTSLQYFDTCKDLGANPAKGLLLADARALLRNAADQDVDAVHKTVRRTMRERQAMADNPLASQDSSIAFTPLFGRSALRSPGSKASSPPRSVKIASDLLQTNDFWSSPERWRSNATPIRV